MFVYVFLSFIDQDRHVARGHVPAAYHEIVEADQTLATNIVLNNTHTHHWSYCSLNNNSLIL